MKPFLHFLKPIALLLFLGQSFSSLVQAQDSGNFFLNFNGNGVKTAVALDPIEVGLNGALDAETDYEVKILAANILTDKSFTISNNGSANTAEDLRVSDAVLFGTDAVIAYKTGTAGQNNHSLDFGFKDAPPPCVLDIVSATPSACDPATNTYILSVAVTYTDAPGAGIRVKEQDFTTNGSGSETFLVVLNANGIQNQFADAQFVAAATCADTFYSFNAPASCAVDPVCNLNIVAATPSVCDAATNTYTVAVSVTYTNAPNGNLLINNQGFVPNGSGAETFTLSFLGADGAQNVPVISYFQATPTCADTFMAYNAPVSCGNSTNCNITIQSATPSACDPANNTYTLAVAVVYSNPASGDISINGQNFTPNGSGAETFTLINLGADGTQNVPVSAVFLTNGDCYHGPVLYNAPASCNGVVCDTVVNNLCIGESYTLTAMAGLVAIQWQKSINNGATYSDIPLATAATYTVIEPGFYRFVAQDGSGCSVNMCCPYRFASLNCPTDKVAVGNLVFADANQSGTFDAGDVGIDSVVIQLYAASQTPGVDAPIATTITANGGFYLFDQLEAGMYKIFIPSSNFVSGAPLSNQISGNPEGTDSDTNEAVDENGQNTPVNGGITSTIINLQPNTEPASETGAYAGILDDDNVNLTVDFGFVPKPCPAPICIPVAIVRN